MYFKDANQGWATSDYGGIARYLYDPANTYTNTTLNGPWFVYNSNPINPYNDNLLYMTFNGMGSILNTSGFGESSGNYTVNPDGTFVGTLNVNTESFPLIGQLTTQKLGTVNAVGQQWTMSQIPNQRALKDRLTGTLTTQNCGTKNVVFEVNTIGQITSTQFASLFHRSY